MKHKIQFAVALVTLAILLLASVALAQVSANFDAVWSRFASGGGQRESVNFHVQDIVGQWVSESPASSNAQIVTDFYWAGDASPTQLYIPVVFRQ